MDERTIDHRIAELQSLLRHAWEPKQLSQLTEAVVVAQRARNTDQLAAQVALRDYLGARARYVVERLDAFISEVPCTRYSRIRYMEVLTGHPLAWGTTFDINERAKRLRDDVQEKASAFPEGPNDLWRRIQEARLSGDSKELEKLLDEDGRIREFASEQVDAVRSPLLTELLRVLQHMDDARAQWEKAPVRAGNFQDYLGADRFPKVEAAMRELGITPKQGKGKNQVVAALHCACERFGLRLPPPGRWPGMLEATYPSTTWSEKCVPEERKSYRTKSYHRAYQAVLDRLK